jgi:hypothetical protein
VADTVKRAAARSRVFFIVASSEKTRQGDEGLLPFE